MLELYLGGARSGKSRLAEQRALAGGKSLIYIATAAAGDSEMAARIAIHRQRRDPRWTDHEVPLALAESLQACDNRNSCVLVDCLTLWLSNCLHEGELTWQKERQALLDCLPMLQADIIFVSNEVGMGVVPMGELSRRFVDESGFLHQQLAAQCERVVFTVAGLPQVLKG